MSLSTLEFDYIRTLVQKRSAIVMESEKAYLAETRLAPLARREGCESVNHLVNRLRAEGLNGLHQKVVEAMTINETSFLRDVKPFEALRKVVLPELLQKRAAERRLHIWSAACSTGQEPFSIAMLLREFFPILQGWNVQLIASDLSSEVLERARQGRFSQMEINRGLPAAYLVKYFQRVGMDWHIKPEVRSQIDFRQLNLIESWPNMPLMDVVLLRNVLIYFAVETKKAVLGRVRSLLRPDGYLFLGGAETTLNLDDAFERVEFERSGCYRLRDAKRPSASC